jgi:hypothetical protein
MGRPSRFDTFPETRAKLIAAHFVLLNNDAKCKGCGMDIEWWKTPTDKKIPMNPMPLDFSAAIAHWVNCTARENFKQNAGTHRCAALNCKEQIAPTLLMCPGHWEQVVPFIQREVMAAWRKLRADEPHAFWPYALARERAINWVARKEGLRDEHECFTRENNIASRIEPQGGLFA